MQFVYTPEGAASKRWDFRPEKLMSPEAEAIERHTGMTYAEWSSAVQRGSMLALHGLLFVLLKRSIPTLKWDEVQFCLDEIDFEVEDDEASEIRAVLEQRAADGPLSTDDQATLDKLREQDVPAVDPKAPAA